MNCPNCGRPIYGFWKYGVSMACSMKCFREQVDDGRIAKLHPERAYPELGILPQNQNNVQKQEPLQK